MNDQAFYNELKRLKNLGVTAESDKPRECLAEAYRDLSLCMQELCDRETFEGIDEWAPEPIGQGSGPEYFRKAIERMAKGDKNDDIDTMVRKFYYLHMQDRSPHERYQYLVYYQGVDMFLDSRYMNNGRVSANPPEYYHLEYIIRMLISDDEAKIGEKLIKKFFNERSEKEMNEGLAVLDELCQDDDEPLDLDDHTLANEVSLVVDSLTDSEMKIVLDHTSDCYRLRMMKMLRGRTRRKILMNLSERARGIMAYDLYHGIDPEKIATDGAGGSCIIFLETYIKLRKKGEIVRKDDAGHDIPPESESAYIVAEVYRDAHKTKLTVWEEEKTVKSDSHSDIFNKILLKERSTL